MRKLDRFILKSFMGPFIAVLLVVLFVLMMQFLWLYIDELVGKGLSFGTILEFLFWGICSTALPLALPLTTLLSSVMTVGQMAENNELLAMKASGLSFARIIAPIMIVCGIVSVGTFFVLDNLVPYAYNKILTLRTDIQKTKDEIKIPSGTFYDGIEGYVLRVDDRDKETGMMYGVMVYDHTGRKGNTSLTMADSALLKMSKSKDYLTFTLHNGTNYQETNVKKYRDTTLDLQKINFIKQDLIIPLENYTFEKSEESQYGDQYKAMKMDKIVERRDSLNAIVDDMQNVHNQQFLLMCGLARSRQLDSTSIGRDARDFEWDGYLQWKEPKRKAEAYQTALNKADEISNMLISYNHDINDPAYYLPRLNTEVLKRYAGALACLILFFIGAPLGALMKKGGLGSSAIVSALFFVLYWVVDISATKMGRDGNVTPSTAAFLSAYVLLPIGIFLTWKAIKDAALFNTDTLKSGWRRFKSKIMGIFKKTRIVYMGTPDFAVAPLDALIKAGYNVVGVVTVADKPSGRGLKVNESAVKKYAVEHGLPVLQPVKLKDPEFLEQLAAWKADLFVVVAFRMLPEVVWTMPRLGTFNLHAALLPQYRGAAPINWAVINGEQMTGVTTFLIDKEIDTGKIIFREEHRIKDTDNVGDVHDALMEIGSDLVVRTVQGLIENNVETRVQRSFIQGSEVLKPAPKLTRELCHIDWNDTTRHIYNLIRGLSPYPAAFTEIVPAGRDDAAPLQLKIYEAARMTADDVLQLNGGAPAVPGTVLSDGKNILAVATADGAIEIRDLQLSGKKRMATADFLRGFREPQSYVCTPGTSKAEIAKTRA